jgi:hypothetical protein
MTTAFPQEKTLSLADWLQRAFTSLLPTSEESQLDVLRPTELRYVPVSTNDTQGSASSLTGLPGVGVSLTQPQFDELSRQTAGLASTGTTHDAPSTALAAMSAAAAAQDENAFLAACSLVDWQQCDAADFETAIHLALAAGAHLAARRLAAEGAARHPAAPYL